MVSPYEIVRKILEHHVGNISKTSFAWIATLGDSSWARLTIGLTSWNLPNSQLCLESKTEPSVANWGGHRTKKHKLRGGDTAHTFLIGGTIGVGKTYTYTRRGKQLG